MLKSAEIADFWQDKAIPRNRSQMHLPWLLVNAEELGRRIRAARAYVGLNTEELAERVGMGASTLHRTEHGKRAPKKWELWGIAEVCQLPRGWFVTDWTEVFNDAGELESSVVEIEQALTTDVPARRATDASRTRRAGG